MKELVSNGSMIIANDGCGEYSNLILTGPQSGNVWAFPAAKIISGASLMDFLDFVEMPRDPISGLTDLLEKLRGLLEAHKLDPKYLEGVYEYNEDEILKLKIISSREAKHNHKLDGWL